MVTKNEALTYKDSATRALATFIAGATAAPISAAVFDVSFLKAAGVAGLIAVWNLLGRWAQTYLQSRG
jgi:hypothetical protein